MTKLSWDLPFFPNRHKRWGQQESKLKALKLVSFFNAMEAGPRTKSAPFFSALRPFSAVGLPGTRMKFWRETIPAWPRKIHSSTTDLGTQRATASRIERAWRRHELIKSEFSRRLNVVVRTLGFPEMREVLPASSAYFVAWSLDVPAARENIDLGTLHLGVLTRTGEGASHVEIRTSSDRILTESIQSAAESPPFRATELLCVNELQYQTTTTDTPSFVNSIGKHDYFRSFLQCCLFFFFF